MLSLVSVFHRRPATSRTMWLHIMAACKRWLLDTFNWNQSGSMQRKSCYPCSQDIFKGHYKRAVTVYGFEHQLFIAISCTMCVFIFLGYSLLHCVDWLLTKCVSPSVVDLGQALDHVFGLPEMLQLWYFERYCYQFMWIPGLGCSYWDHISRR